MKTKLLFTSIAAICLASPAFAASYYVVQNKNSHKCTVVLQKPSATSKAYVLLGADTGYKTKKEATTAMGTINECKPT